MAGGPAGSEGYAPSGRQVEITSGEHAATVVEVGGGLRSYSWRGRDVLDGYRRDQMVTAGRGDHLIPWPNRIRHGDYTWDGRELRAPLNDRSGGHAIHGFTRWMGWRFDEVTPSSVTTALRLHPLQGYPFALDLSARHELSDEGLTVTVTATNAGPDAAPFAYAPHPYLTTGAAGLVDEQVLHVPASTCMLLDDDGIPTGRTPVEGTAYDFRTPRPIGDLRLDTTYTGLEPGRTVVDLATADGAAGVSLWFDSGTFPYVQVFTGDTVPEVERRRTSVAVEPMTSPADAFRTGEDVVRLEPGATWSGTWGITPR